MSKHNSIYNDEHCIVLVFIVSRQLELTFINDRIELFVIIYQVSQSVAYPLLYP